MQFGTYEVERRSKRDSVSGSDSDEDSQINIHALFNGLSNDQRAEMVEQWKALVALGADDARSSGINKFYEFVYFDDFITHTLYL
jgi:hypothetical protein